MPREIRFPGAEGGAEVGETHMWVTSLHPQTPPLGMERTSVRVPLAPHISCCHGSAASPHRGCVWVWGDRTWRELLTRQSRGHCLYQIGERAWASQKRAVAMLEFTDEDTPMQENNLPKVTWAPREGARPWPAPQELSPSVRQEPRAEKAAGFVGASPGPKSPKQASLCRHV